VPEQGRTEIEWKKGIKLNGLWGGCRERVPFLNSKEMTFVVVAGWLQRKSQYVPLLNQED